MASERNNPSTNGVIPVSSLQKLQFEWLTRSAQLSGMSMMIVDSGLNIKFYDQKIAAALELDTGVDYTGRNILELVETFAKRGDFGPGDANIFVELLSAEFSKPAREEHNKPRSLDFLTPSGRRVQFSLDSEVDGLYMLGCRDVTDNHIQKQALKVAMDSSNSGYLIFDMETKKLQIQSTINEDAFGHHFTKSVLDGDFKNAIHPDDFLKLKVVFSEALKKKVTWASTFRTKDQKGETIWLKVQGTPQIAESGRVISYILFYTEVTSQLRIQDDLRKANEKSDKALQAKNAFLGRLSHEIRTPMNAVVGIADALIHHNGNPEIAPKLELIQTSAEKIIRIVDESLVHTKLAEAKVQLDPHAASPRTAVESVCALWEQKAVENAIDLTCRIDDSIPDSMIFDSFRYEQCLNNLVSNAVKFSPAGKIQVVLTTLEKGGRKSLVTVVKDNGIGMNESQLENLFEAYTQADKSISGRFGGTGLGMNITKQFIELMGGQITAKSALGAGTLIALTLPIQLNRREDDRRKETVNQLVDDMLEEAAPPASEYEKLNVLVVDDNATNHLVVTSLLGTMVRNIEVAENGIEAIEALENAEENGDQFDVILMDIHMPIMDGIEATLAIRGSQEPYTDIPIIALTADPQYQQKRLCKNIGMDDALAKPVKLTEVLGALDRVFAIRDNSELAA